jgi:hypothetical protein
MTSQETTQQTQSSGVGRTQYTVEKFMSERDAIATSDALVEAGFAPEYLSIEVEPLDPMHGIAESQVKEGAKGGALVGATFGATLTGSLALLAHALASPENVGPHNNFILVMILGAIAGALGVGIIGAISGRNTPKLKAGTDGTHQYRVMLLGTRADVDRATEILSQQSP